MRRTVSPLAALALLCAPAVFTIARQQQPPPPAPAASPTPAQTPAQQASPAQTPPVEIEDEEVVHITTNLVQLDAVVLDKHGKQVTDLKAEDFQVFEDGKPRKITHFSYVATEPAAPPAAAAANTPKPDRNAAPPPPRKLRPEQVRRAMALVVDDLGLSFESTANVRRVLRDFVDKHVGATDLVAIIRTSAGAGALQQFTNDRRQLYAAIDRVRWYPHGRGSIGAFAPLEDNSIEREMQSMAGGAGGSTGREELDDFRQEYFAVGTLGAMNFVVNGMKELPGRKSVVLFSDGFRLYSPDRGRGSNDRLLQSLRRLTDLANRAAVVIYTMDARGLVFTGLTAADDTGGRSGQELADVQSQRSQELFETQEGLQVMAEQTGGLAVRNANDLPVGRILEDQKGYYLIGYRPEGQTFDRRFHTLNAKLVNRPGLSLRTRRGFFGVTDEQTRPPARRTREQQLYGALTSPFGAGGVGLRLTALFTHTEKTGSILSSLLHVDARDLKFAKQPDGQYEARVELVGVTFADSGRVVDQHGVAQSLRMREEVYQRVLREGIVYRVNVPIKKPGAYQLRVALRDAATEKVGAASQFVEVPDLKKDRLALSGIVLTGAAAAATAGAPGESAGQSVAGTGEGTVETRDAQASAAVRRFRQRTIVDYAGVIFNARADKATRQPQLAAQLRLYRDGQLVYTGKESPVQLSAGDDPKRIVYGGRISLGANLAPGDYVLQVIVNDQLRDEKHRAATQWIDFEIVK